MATTAPPFQGIVTTGIYCRPGCPATPLPKNARPFQVAAAAESAGFRPCLRCRPDRLPGPDAWAASPELVCRAVRLIADGGLDGHTEDDLAARLGVSARHLRRLFQDHVGATPDAVARSRRAHLARRLLDETDLPVADVAFAAGFASVRQMNRVMKDIFQFTPTELRSKRRRDDRLVADGGLDLRVPYRGELAWDELVAYLSARAIPGVEQVTPEAYRRTILLDGEPGVIELFDVPGSDHVRLRVHLPTLVGLNHVVAGVRRILDLDTDNRPIVEHLRADRTLARRMRAMPGLRVPGSYDSFELGVRAIVGQQVSVRGASTLAGRIAEVHGTPVPGLGPLGLTTLFPAPEVLADADLDAVGLPRRRAETIHAFARAVAGGSLVLDAAQGLETLVHRLTELPGIGPWTAQYIAMRGAGEPDAFPSGDLALRRSLNGSPLSERELEGRSGAWRPWRSYAAMALWLQPDPKAAKRRRH